VIRRHSRPCPAGGRPLAQADLLKETLNTSPQCASIGELMAFEGSAAKIYFGVFDQLILQQREDFAFQERSRRPPLDNMNLCCRSCIRS
jgi:CRISPR-associated protein Cas1